MSHFAGVRRLRGFGASGLRGTDSEAAQAPHSGKRQSFPEIDRIAYFTLPSAKLKIIGYQLPLLDEIDKRAQD